MERVLVIGASVAGLASALALKRLDVEVVIVERDGPLPVMDPRNAFDEWKRPGVPQFHHSHILLSRLHTTLRDHHPELLAELFEAGVSTAEIEEMLPAEHMESYERQLDDGDLLHLWTRRATFEYVLRRHVEAQSRVTMMCDARVEGLLADVSEQGVQVKGLRVRTGDEVSELAGDVVIDSSGSRSPCRAWLQELGVDVSFEEHASAYAYFCRHYKLKDVEHPPSRRGTGANLDYLWYGIFYAEDGNFSVAIACPLEEKALLDRLRRGEGFEQVCERMPALARWTTVATPTTAVMGAGASPIAGTATEPKAPPCWVTCPWATVTCIPIRCTAAVALRPSSKRMRWPMRSREKAIRKHGRSTTSSIVASACVRILMPVQAPIGCF